MISNDTPPSVAPGGLLARHALCVELRVPGVRGVEGMARSTAT